MQIFTLLPAPGMMATPLHSAPLQPSSLVLPSSKATTDLVLLLELLHGTKVQEAHVHQLLQVLMKRKDVFPGHRNEPTVENQRKSYRHGVADRKQLSWKGKRLTV